VPFFAEKSILKIKIHFSFGETNKMRTMTLFGFFFSKGNKEQNRREKKKEKKK